MSDQTIFQFEHNNITFVFFFTTRRGKNSPVAIEYAYDSMTGHELDIDPIDPDAPLFSDGSIPWALATQYAKLIS